MGIISNLIQVFSSTGNRDETIPVGGKIYTMRTTEFETPLKYDYETIEKLLEDERVFSIVALVSSMVCKAYVGPDIIPKDRFTDEVIDDKEKKALAAADKAARDLNIKQAFFNYTWQLVSHGDLFEKIIKDGSGIQDVISLPLNSTRVLASEDQVKKQGQGVQITEENIITVKQHKNDTNPTVYKKGEYFHLSFKNHAVWRKDNEQSDTYGIYSKPPIASLQRLVNWKKKTIENDIIWKNKLLPRILYKLKLGSIVPSKYVGATAEEKVDKARKDAELVTEKFINTTRNLRPDDDIVVSDAVDSSVLEAKSVNYHQPNDTISQINTLLNTPQGIPGGLLGGDTGASMGIELAAIFAGIRVDYIAQIIADAWTKVLKSHVRLSATAAGEETIDRLFIHIDPALSVEKFEKVKTALSMTTMNVFTKGEIRKAAGYARLPQLPKEAFPDVDIKAAKDTLAQVTGDIKKEKPNSRENNTSPQGDRNTTEDQRPN